MLESLFNKIAGLQACNFINKNPICKIFKSTCSKEHPNDCFFISEIQATNNVIYYGLAEKFQFQDL